jgi:uncharacterized protein GlcG (DUF336 family)
MGESSRELGQRLKERPAFLGALSDLSDGKVVPVPGGVLILGDNNIIGAVGVSGGTSDEDEACAIDGIQATGLKYKIWRDIPPPQPGLASRPGPLIDY